MSLTQNIKGRGQSLGTVARSGMGSRGRPQRVLVIEQTRDGGWKSLEAEISPEGVAVLAAHTTVAGATGQGEGLRANGCSVALVPNLQTSVCRVLDLPDAAPEQVEQLVAMRLEVELPFPVADSTWVCEPYTNGAGTAASVLLIAASTREIAEAENVAHSKGIRSANVEFAPAALGDLALASDPTTDTFAVLGLDDSGAILVIGHGRRLYYVRPIWREEQQSVDAWTPGLAMEVRQALYDYLLRTGYGMPRTLLVAGTRMGQAGFFESLEAHLELPVKAVTLPDTVDGSRGGLSQAELVSEYPVALGVVLGMQRRLTGAVSAAPPIQKPKAGFEGFGWRARGTRLLAVNAVLLVALVAASAVSQSLRLNAANDLLRESAPVQGNLDRLQEEVETLRFEEKRTRSMLDAVLALAETLPAEVKVETLSIDSKGKVTLAGKAPSVELASDSVPAALKASKAFVNPVFHGATKESDGFGFRITCELKGGGR